MAASLLPIKRHRSMGDGDGDAHHVGEIYGERVTSPSRNGVAGSEHAENGSKDQAEQWQTVPAGASRKKQKKEKKRQNPDTSAPLFQFDPAGFSRKGVRRQVHVYDIRDLIINILDKHPPPSWLRVSNKSAIRGVVCLLVPGIEPSTLGLPDEVSDILPQPLSPSKTLKTSKLPIFQHLFSHYCPTRAPGDDTRIWSVPQTLLNSMVPEADKAQRDAARQATAAVSGGRDPSLYLLDRDDFLDNGYIVPTYDFDILSRRLDGPPSTTSDQGPAQSALPFERWQRPDGLIETPQPQDVSSSKPNPLRIVAIDCEMCKSEGASELCRISVVDADGQLLYDTLVKPDNKVVDYATAYSGITEEMLVPVTTRLVDVQRRLTEIIDYDTVLVGHSLNCDLAVLKLAHPWIIDTSIILQHTRGPPFKASLKWLAEKWLHKEIQQKSTTADGVTTLGHNSEEDARAAVELVRLKMKNGPLFGEFAGNQESIFERLGRSDPARRTCVIDHGKASKWHGTKATTALSCTSDDEVAAGVCENVASHDFVFARLADLSQARGWAKNNADKVATAVVDKALSKVSNGTSQSGLKDEITQDNHVLTVEEAYAKVNNYILAVHAAAPANTALIVLTGHRDPRSALALLAKRNQCDVLRKNGKLLSHMSPEEVFTELDQRNLESFVATAREGMSFYAIKR